MSNLNITEVIMFSKLTIFKGASSGKSLKQQANKSSFSTAKVHMGFKERVFKLTDKLFNMYNPVIGKEMFKHERTGVFMRVDGRDPSAFHKEGGLKPRVDQKRIEVLTFEDVINYQRFNLNPFGWGCCKSFSDLLAFINNNKSHADSRWIIVFYGTGTSLLDLKLRTGIESDGYDMETEYIVTRGVPFDNMVAATSPNSREKFMEGALVPNVMHNYNPSLPKVLRKEDISSGIHLLTWLLKHNSEEAFVRACTHLYKGKSEETINIMLEGDTVLFAAVKAALKTVDQQQEPRIKM
ncbi:hypothetical protein [Legionella waltersii]|nr:hypothetical protein [Legionella waltersii]